MAGPSFTFLQANSLRLGRPIVGVGDVPDWLRAQLIEAPRAAVQRVFDTAIREEVDFVVLCGDVIEPGRAGPATIQYLIDQFESLARHSISVYWSASHNDLSDNYLDRILLPANVHRLASDRIEQLTHCRGDQPVATIVGRSWNVDGSRRVSTGPPEGDGVFRLAVHYDVSNADPAYGPINFWAAGGTEARRQQLERSGTLWFAAGAPQGLQPCETGRRECAVIHVDGEGEVRVRHEETDEFRWEHERLDLGEGPLPTDLRTTLRARADEMKQANRPLLVHWTLAGDGVLESRWAREAARSELLGWLRSEYGHGSHPLWSLSLGVEPPAVIQPEWCDEDSILGDYLTAVRAGLEDGTAEDLSAYMPQRSLPDEIRARLLGDADASDEALRSVAVLAFDLLCGDQRTAHTAARYGPRTGDQGVPS